MTNHEVCCLEEQSAIVSIDGRMGHLHNDIGGPGGREGRERERERRKRGGEGE